MIRLIGYFFGIGTVLFLIVAAGIAWYIGDVSKDLPDYEVLNSYEPPVTTRVHAASVELMAEYATRAAVVPADPGDPRPGQGSVPVGRRQEFLSSPRRRSGRHRPRGVRQQHPAPAAVQGASTITQQVAKNFLLSDRQRSADL
jgi:penicillin-binding protein 1A